MRKHRLPLYVIAAMLVALPGAAAAQRRGPARGSLSGQVLEPEGKAAAGARVLLQTSDGYNPRTTKADANGRFRFPALRPGLYDVRAQAAGQSSDWEHNLLIRSGRETRVTLRLSNRPTPTGRPPTKEPPPPTKKPAPR